MQLLIGLNKKILSGCEFVKKNSKKYPDFVYKGITDNENSWGMCCSREMAEECAEEYYKNNKMKMFKEEVLDDIVASFFVFIMKIIAFIIILFACFLISLIGLGIVSNILPFVNDLPLNIIAFLISLKMSWYFFKKLDEL